MSARLAFALSGVLFVGCLAVGPPSGPGGTSAELDGAIPDAPSSPDSANCVGARCTPLECPSETHAAPLPGECCATDCIPDDCSLADCAAIRCAPGSRAVTARGHCCATCVVDETAPDPANCTRGQDGYAQYLEVTLTTLGAVSCAADADCRVVALVNPCSSDCGTAVNARSVGALLDRLEAYAAAHCGACVGTGPACPPVERRAYCTGGFCTVH